MNTLFGGVRRLLVRMESASMRFGFAFVRPSAGLIAPGIRHVECILDAVMDSRHR